MLNTSHEIDILKGSLEFIAAYSSRRSVLNIFWPDAIKEYGTANSDGKYSVAYGVLFDKTANTRALLLLLALINFTLNSFSTIHATS